MIDVNLKPVHNINLELFKTNIQPFKILKYVTVKYASKEKSILNVKIWKADRNLQRYQDKYIKKVCSRKQEQDAHQQKLFQR